MHQEIFTMLCILQWILIISGFFIHRHESACMVELLIKCGCNCLQACRIVCVLCLPYALVGSVWSCRNYAGLPLCLPSFADGTSQPLWSCPSRLLSHMNTYVCLPPAVHVHSLPTVIKQKLKRTDIPFWACWVVGEEELNWDVFLRGRITGTVSKVQFTKDGRWRGSSFPIPAASHTACCIGQAK